MKKYIIKLGKKAFEIATRISPTFSAKVLYYVRLGKIPNLKDPQDFNEKLTWLKLYRYGNNPKISLLADKYAVRTYVEGKGYGDILNKLYGVYDSADDIDFNTLPNRFALKATHGCAFNAIINEKSTFDTDMIREKANSWLRETYGLATTELHYTKIKPKLIVEENISSREGVVPPDYKFFCFYGEPKLVQVVSERGEGYKLNYFDLGWKELDYGALKYRSHRIIPKPKNFAKMVEVAKVLSDGLPFVRVDLYNENGKIIFGELTFTPACSCSPYFSPNGLTALGELLKLGD